MNNVKGLTATFIFEAESANYGEGVGNVTSLKKISRDGGKAYTYISRQALRYNMSTQMGEYNTPLNMDDTKKNKESKENDEKAGEDAKKNKKVIQFHPDATIKDYAEIDLFGYMKTNKPVKTRSAVVRLSNAIALETFNADLDFLTNKGLLDRYNETAKKKKEGGNIAQSEIHKTYYTYTISIDLDKIGTDTNDNIKISKEEKAKRVNKLLDTIKFLYRDIKGRRENLSPLFAIGGIYDIKNPFFENRIKCYNNKISVEPLKAVLGLDKEVEDNTKVGLIKGIFNNSDEIVKELGAEDMSNFFDDIKKQVNAYYEV